MKRALTAGRERFTAAAKAAETGGHETRSAMSALRPAVRWTGRQWWGVLHPSMTRRLVVRLDGRRPAVHCRWELFDKLGMEHVTMEVDGGVRVLPRGRVDYSATATIGTEFGYGAGFWTNRGDGTWTQRRVRSGMPADSFMAMGNFGQYVVIIPSKNLVIARLGNSHTPMGDIQTVIRLVADVVAALDER